MNTTATATIGMNYRYQPKDPSRRAKGLVIVIALHAFMGYALVSGMARKGLNFIKKPLEAVVIQEVIIPPPPPPTAEEGRDTQGSRPQRSTAATLCAPARCGNAHCELGHFDCRSDQRANGAGCDCTVTPHCQAGTQPQ